MLSSTIAPFAQNIFRKEGFEVKLDERIILHSDLNSFYASVELMLNPSLRGKPVAVCGRTEERHGIVLAKSDPAKKAGVKTGMVNWEAKKLCPGLVIVPPNYDQYLKYSRLTREIYGRFTDRVESFGLDECWLDITGCVRAGGGLATAEEIRRTVRDELGLTVSVGVSWNKIFAKLGSDMKKPDAITTITREDYREKVWPLPIEDLLYVGRATGRKLRDVCIRTIGDLAMAREDFLVRRLGKAGSMLYGYANGYDLSPVQREDYAAPIKSIGNSTTTYRDMTCDEDVRLVLFALSESVGARFRENAFEGSVVEVSVRDSELSHFTRQRKLEKATNITSEIAEAGYSIFRGNYHWHKPLRCIGIRAAGLNMVGKPEQLDLFCDHRRRDRLRRIDGTVDEIRRRFGYGSIQRGLMFADTRLAGMEPHTQKVTSASESFGGSPHPWQKN
jgi:DNA polymerase-4